MKYISGPGKLYYRLILTQKAHIIMGFVLVFLFLTSLCQAETIFEDNFDSYNIGTLHNQGNWTCSFYTWEVNTEDFQSSPQSIKDEAVSYVSQCQKNGASTTEGSISFWFKTTNCGYGASRRERLEFRFSGIPYASYPNVEIKSTSDNGCHIKLSPISDTDYVSYDTFDNWTRTIIRWKIIDSYYWFKWGWGDNVESDWTLSIYNIGNFPSGFDRIQIYGTYGSGGNYFWVDSIEEAPAPCVYFTNWFDCQGAGCCWSYLPEGLTWIGPISFCEVCPSGVCASSWEDCQNCLTEEECNAQDYCFWYLNTCRYGKTPCSGISLQLCDNQTDCENAGGYWYDNACWYYGKPTYFTSWEDWYAEHGNYATPTAFINNIASSTQNFFEIIGGFLAGFSEIFNLQEAYERGIGLGSAVPVARGHLVIFNDFLGGFPISEIFIFILIFMLAIGVFRLISRLLQLVKFW